MRKFSLVLVLLIVISLSVNSLPLLAQDGGPFDGNVA